MESASLVSITSVMCTTFFLAERALSLGVSHASVVETRGECVASHAATIHSAVQEGVDRGPSSVFTLSGEDSRFGLSGMFAYSKSGSFLTMRGDRVTNASVVYVGEIYFNGERTQFDHSENLTPIDKVNLGAISEDGRFFALPLEERKGSYEGTRVGEVLFVFGQRIALEQGEVQLGAGVFAADSGSYMSMIRRPSEDGRSIRISLMTVMPDGQRTYVDLFENRSVNAKVSNDSARILGLHKGEPFVLGTNWAALGQKPLSDWVGSTFRFESNNFVCVKRVGAMVNVNVNGEIYREIGPVQHVSFSGDGVRHGLVTNSLGVPNQREVRVDGKVVATLASATPVRFSPNGKHAGFGKLEQVDGKWLHRLMIDGQDMPAPGRVFDIALADNGDFITVCGKDEDPQMIIGSKGWKFDCRSFAWLGASAETNRLGAVRIAGKSQQTRTFHIIVDGEELPEAYANAGRIVFSPDGNHYAVAVKRHLLWTLVVDGREVHSTGGELMPSRDRPFDYHGDHPGIDPVFVENDRVRWFFKESGSIKRFDYLIQK